MGDFCSQNGSKKFHTSEQVLFKFNVLKNFLQDSLLTFNIIFLAIASSLLYLS